MEWKKKTADLHTSRLADTMYPTTNDSTCLLVYGIWVFFQSSKACKLLCSCSRGIAADTPHTRASLKKAQHEQYVTPCIGDTGSYDPSEIKAILERTPSNLAPGPSRLRFDHLKAALLLPDQSTVNHFLFALTTFVNTAPFLKNFSPSCVVALLFPVTRKTVALGPLC